MAPQGHGDLLKEVMVEFNEAADLLVLEPNVRERLSHSRKETERCGTRC